MIPAIDIGPLFESNRADKAAIDDAILHAAFDVGFMTITGVPHLETVGPRACKSILRLFDVPKEQQRSLWKKNFAPENPNLYRGWFPLEADLPKSREGFDIGPDLVRALPEDHDDDLLYESSVFPSDDLFPSWRADAAAYYRTMEEIGYAILASLSRAMDIDEDLFHDSFRDGISTLRLLHYPSRDLSVSESPKLENYFTTWNDERFEVVCGSHFDSGLVTILAQCDAGGLQVKNVGGEWTDVPVTPDGFVVNFGGLLARWTGGRVRATKHRVLSKGGERYSIPFFFEPRPDAVIAPLPLDGIEPFEPFEFGDHLWATTTQFSENFGLGDLRPARAPYTDPFAKR